MFQDFVATSSPEQGPPRLAALRAEARRAGLDGFLVPRADAHQGEYVADHDARLAWLTGFTGSAGFCAALHDVAGVFVDGRYRTQVRGQVDLDHFTPVNWPEVQLGDWLAEMLPDGGRVGFDPWLHTAKEIEALRERLGAQGVELVACDNLVDAIWDDQPPPPCGAIAPYPEDLAGDSHGEKRARIAATLKEAGQRAAVLTLADSIAWLLNIRGSDIPRNPVPHCFAVLHDSAHLTLFVDPGKCDAALRDHLGEEITLRPPEAFGPGLRSLTGPVRVDRDSAPLWVSMQLEEAGVATRWGEDPCLLPKARKTPAEIAATREAHLRDGAAMCNFLGWFDGLADKTALTEIDLVRRLEETRRATNALRDISFDTICGSGPNGAVMHYRVTEASNRALQEGDLVVLDSGGQYLDGTTDITRTLPVGTPPEEARAAYTRVLQGLIAMSRLRFPRGLAGRDIEAVARAPLWMAGQDFDHGTGHGVGVYLCVHEGPQRLSRTSHVPLEPGMILSNEPGYYREGAFGIRLENLIVVREAEALPGGDAGRAMRDFETLTYVPFARALIDRARLTAQERSWLDAYHAECRARIAPRVDGAARAWLDEATQPL